MNKPTSNKKSNGNNVEELKVDNFCVTRARVLSSGSVSFDMQLNGISIYGCFVVEGKYSDFISFPQRKGTDGKYYSIVWARLSKDDTEMILAEVEKKLNE